MNAVQSTLRQFAGAFDDGATRIDRIDGDSTEVIVEVQPGQSMNSIGASLGLPMPAVYQALRAAGLGYDPRLADGKRNSRGAGAHRLDPDMLRAGQKLVMRFRTEILQAAKTSARGPAPMPAPEVPRAVIESGQQEPARAAVEARLQNICDLAARLIKEPNKRDTAAREPNSEAVMAIIDALKEIKNDPAALDTALARLSAEQLSVLVHGATGAHDSLLHNDHEGGMGALLVRTYNVEPLRKLLDVAADGISAEQKARIFAVAAGELKEMETTYSVLSGVIVQDRRRAVNEVTKSLATLLSSDTNGVVRALEQRDRSAVALTSFVRGMVDANRTTELRLMIAQLQRGNDGRSDPMEHFSRTEMGADGGPYYSNAQRLGYFMGAVQAAIQTITANVDKQSTILKVIFGAGLSAGKDVAGYWLAAGAKAFAGLIVAGLVVAGVDAIDARIMAGVKRDYKALADTIVECVFPRDAQANTRYRGAAETAYDAARARVVIDITLPK